MMAVPAPPPKPGAPKDLLDAWSHLSQKVRLEDDARRSLKALEAAHASHGTIIAAQKVLAFTQDETKRVLDLYEMDYEAAYPSDTRTEKAS